MHVKITGSETPVGRRTSFIFGVLVGGMLLCGNDERGSRRRHDRKIRSRSRGIRKRHVK